MGIGIRRNFKKLRVFSRVLQAKLLYSLWGLEEIVLFIRRLDKASTVAVLKQFGANIDPNCDIESGIMVHQAHDSFANLTVEGLCHVGKEVFLDLRAPIVIHQGSTIGMRSVILTHFHPGYSLPGQDSYAACEKGVEIGPNSYIGAGATILAGVKVGQNSMVGAGALVNRDVPENVVAVGIPARVIKKVPR